MRTGKVISINVSHKNGNTIIKTGEKVTENDVHDFDSLVKSGHIKEFEAKTAKKAENKQPEKPKASSKK